MNSKRVPRIIKSAKILWVYLPQDSNLTKENLEALVKDLYIKNYTGNNIFKGNLQVDGNLFLYSSYKDFYTESQKEDSLLATDNPKLIVIHDNPYLLGLCSPSENVYTLGFSVGEKLQVLYEFGEEDLKVHKVSNSSELMVNKELQAFSLKSHTNENLNYYERILSTYNKIVFFEFFNDFKYSLKPENRKLLESVVYKFFIQELDKESLKVNLEEIESTLTLGQTKKFKEVRNFLESSLADILLQCVKEENKKIVQDLLLEYRLDYFDVNYLKSFLVSFVQKQEDDKEKDILKEAQKVLKGSKGNNKYQKFDSQGNEISNIEYFPGVEQLPQ